MLAYPHESITTRCSITLPFGYRTRACQPFPSDTCNSLAAELWGTTSVRNAARLVDGMTFGTRNTFPSAALPAAALAGVRLSRCSLQLAASATVALTKICPCEGARVDTLQKPEGHLHGCKFFVCGGSGTSSRPSRRRKQRRRRGRAVSVDSELRIL